MMDFTPIFGEVWAHANETPTRECCGLVTVPKGKMAYRRCRNIARDDNDFQIHPEDYVAFSSEGIIGIVHSHLKGSPEPSMMDLQFCEQTQLPWFIVALPTGAVKTVYPTGWKAPLIGRPFVHNVFDCFSLVRDWYALQGISVLDFDREENWWDKGYNLLTPENFAKAGFDIVTDGTLKHGDGVIMQNGTVDIPNHVGVILDGDILLHHSGGRLSCRQPYGGYWQKVTRWVVRHRSL